jgi:O-Antigen ligase
MIMADFGGGHVVTATESRPSISDGTASSTVPAAVLVGALAGGIIAQGGFYLPGHLIVIGLTAVAVVVAMFGSRRRPDPLVGAAAGALAAWMLVRAVTTGGDWSTALAGVATLGVVVAAATLAGPELLPAVTVIGAGVAVTGWVGVAFRLDLWSVLVEDTLWRASSTLTYPNAAAAVLAPLALIALTRRATEPTTARTTLAYVLVVGLGATLSRAGAFSFTVGLAVVVLGVRHRGRLVAPLVGATVAVGALLPSVPVDQPARTGVALGGIVLGLVFATGPDRIRQRAVRRAVLLAGPVALVTAAAVVVPHLSSVTGSRVSLESGGRRGATGAALDLLAQRPWIGHGPGMAWYSWADDTGTGYVAQFVHDEYLQLLVDLGAVGGVLLLALIGAAAYAARRARRAGPLWIGAVAGLAAFAVHSAFDFLWRPAALPLLAGLLLGVALHGEEETSKREEHQ